MAKAPRKPAKPRHYTRKTFKSDEETHYHQSKSPQMGLGNIPGVDLQRFFSYVRFESHGERGKWIRKMDEADRSKIFNHWIRDVMEDFQFPTTDSLRHFLGVSETTMSRMVYRNSRPVSLGFVLDLAYIFQKDPSEIFPELLWMRDIWMKDYMVMIEAAQMACAAGELSAVRECLEGMKYTAQLYPFSSGEDPKLNVLLRTKADVTETQALLSETAKIRQKHEGEWFKYFEYDELLKKRIDEKFKSLRKNYDDVQENFEARKTGPAPEAAD